MDELFTRYMYYKRAVKDGQKSKNSTTESLRKFYEKNNYELITNNNILSDLKILSDFWKDILDFENNIFNSNISMQGGKIGFNSQDAYTQILQSYISGESNARLQIYSDGRIIFGNGTENAKVRLELSNNDTLKIANGSLLLGTGKTIGVGNSVAATTPRNVVAKFEILNDNGISLGYVPIYDTIN